MAIIEEEQTLIESISYFLLEPTKGGDILASVLPLILGALIIETYFGNYNKNLVNWDEALGNSLIWLTTGLNLVVDGSLDRLPEKLYIYSVLPVSGFIFYKSFKHKGEKNIVSMIAAPEIVYPTTYVAVLIIKGNLPLNSVTLKAGAIFALTGSALMYLLRLLPSKQTSSVNL